MKKIGITGGIASGKTTVTKMLSELGSLVIDTDAIAHELARPQCSLWQAYVDYFGKKILLGDNTLNRPLIGKIIFKDEKARQDVNGFSHPLIWDEVQNRLTDFQAAGSKLVFIDVPLLFEVGWDKLVDAVLLVYTPEATQLKRLMARNGYGEKDAKNRLASQLPIEEKKKRADIVIDNSGSLEETKKQVLKIWQAFQ